MTECWLTDHSQFNKMAGYAAGSGRAAIHRWD